MSFDMLIEKIKNKTISIEEVEQQLKKYKMLSEVNIYSLLWINLIEVYLRKFGYIDNKQ